LQREGEQASLLFIVTHGKVKLFQKLSYLDQNENRQYREELVLELSTGQIIGEDFLFYNRDNTYTARASIMGTKCFVVTNSDFLKHFGKVVNSRYQKSAKQLLDARNE
jgi:CRP-like cAMP-binding protein